MFYFANIILSGVKAVVVEVAAFGVKFVNERTPVMMHLHVRQVLACEQCVEKSCCTCGRLCILAVFLSTHF